MGQCNWAGRASPKIEKSQTKGYFVRRQNSFFPYLINISIHKLISKLITSVNLIVFKIKICAQSKFIVKGGRYTSFMYVVRFEIQLINTFGLRSLSSDYKVLPVLLLLAKYGPHHVQVNCYIEFCFGQQQLLSDLGFP